MGILERATTGKPSPIRALLYGVEKIGKSTWAAGAPNPIFLCSEDGLGQALDHVARINLSSYDDLKAAIAELAAGGHGYETVVIDTADWLESLVHNHICKRDKKDGIEDYGYGKGYTAAQDELRLLISDLDALRRSAGMGIVILAHATIKAYNNPEGDNYDRYQLKGHDKFMGLLKEWVDALLFVNRAVFVDKENEKDRKGKGFGGERTVHTEWHPAWDAGNRYGLPAEIEMPLDGGYTVLADHVSSIPKLASELATYISKHMDSAEWPDAAEGKPPVRDQFIKRLGGKVTIKALETQPIAVLTKSVEYLKKIQRKEDN